MGILSKLNIFRKDKAVGNYEDHLFALIVAGGGGTRLWPRSRNKTPKQFLKLFHGKTLVQITAERLHKILPWEKIIVVIVSEDYKKETLKEVPELKPENVLVEPLRKNTAPAHGIGAAYIYKKDKDAVILNAASDHLINPDSKYSKIMKAAATAAFGGDWIVVVGIKPTYPGVGYGHIKRKEKFGVFDGEDVYKCGEFIEKPSLEMAEKFNKSGDYFWNANQYVWRADTYLKALRTYQPKVGAAIDKIYNAFGEKNEEKIILEEYSKIPENTPEGKPMSIDYAVSEKAKNILLIAATYDWTDIGDWNEVWKNLPKDKDGNVFIDGDEPGGEIINIGTSNALIQTDGRLIAVVDVDDVAIIDSHDVLLICKRSQAQSVKKIVEKLKADNRKELL